MPECTQNRAILYRRMEGLQAFRWIGMSASLSIYDWNLHKSIGWRHRNPSGGRRSPVRLSRKNAADKRNFVYSAALLFRNTGYIHILDGLFHPRSARSFKPSAQAVQKPIRIGNGCFEFWADFARETRTKNFSNLGLCADSATGGSCVGPVHRSGSDFAVQKEWIWP